MGPLISEVSMKVTEYEKYLLRSNFEKGQQKNGHFKLFIMKWKRGGFFFCNDIQEFPIGPALILSYVSSFQVQLEEKKNVITGSLRSEGQDSLIFRYGPDADSELQFISEAERGYQQQYRFVYLPQTQKWIQKQFRLLFFPLFQHSYQ